MEAFQIGFSEFSFRYASSVSTEGDSYLEIAERLLRRARTPLTTKQIMDLALMLGEVPPPSIRCDST